MANKTSQEQLEMIKRWNRRQAQIAIRIPPEKKNAIDEHLKLTDETMVDFLMRAAFHQIELDQKKWKRDQRKQ